MSEKEKWMRSVREEMSIKTHDPIRWPRFSVIDLLLLKEFGMGVMM
jgi:hypothetical protein